MADDNDGGGDQKRTGRRRGQRRGTASAEGGDTGATKEQLFQRIVEAQSSPDSFKSTGANLMWVPEEEKGFIIGEITSRDGENVEVQLEDGNKRMVKLNDIHPVNPPSLNKIDDMARLSHLNEPSVLHNLKLRYDDDNIYTYSGLFLVAINPYKKLPIYNPEYVERHKGRRREDVSPHVFTIADTAYRQMLQNKQNQSMLVTGESGAGKTENTKKIIQFLTSVAGAHGGGGKLEQQLLRTNPLLEAFGNAKTIKNDNSSRFGKFIEIDFNAAGFIVGTKIQNYLLETTRVVAQNPNERNFHFFYQLCQNPQTKAKFQLGDVDSYTYLNSTGCTTVLGVDDKKEFAETMTCMEVIGMTEDERDQICSVVAAILHLGNIEFASGQKGIAVVNDKTELNLSSKMLGCDPAKLEDAFTHPTYVARTEIIRTDATPEQAVGNRNALVKSIYNRLFDWIVNKVNESLISKEAIRNFIGVLDIAGFEIFPNNSFEQLCINYTNEKLQQFFNTHMFKKEQEEYMREKIEWQFIDFGLDLQPTIDLIEKPTGILKILDQLTIMQGATEDRLVNEIGKNNKDIPKFKPNLYDKTNFHIVHYAGEVIYNTKGWFLKNVDPLNDDCKKLMAASGVNFMKKLYADYANFKQGASSARFETVSNKYKNQLKGLMELLSSTEPHFIRCIVPNLQKKPGIIEPHLVLHQLRCNGVLEGIRISRKGYPGRIIFKDFVKRYNLLAKKADLSNAQTDKDRAMVIIKASEIQETKQYKIGVSKVFLKAGVEALLEELREGRIAQIIIAAQAAMRGCLARRHHANLKKKIVAIKMIQRNWRSFNQLKDWAWWQVFQTARPWISTWKQEEARKKEKEELEKLKKKLEEEIKAKEALQKEKDNLNKQVSDLQVQIQVFDQKQADSDKSVRDLKTKMADLESNINSLNKDKQMMEEDKTRLQREIDDKIKKLSDKDDSLADAESERGGLLNDIAALKKTISDKEQNIAKLDARIKNSENEVKDWKNKHDGEQQRAYELDRIKSGLDEKLKELNYSLELVSKARIDADNKNKQLNDEIKERKKDIANLQRNIDQLGSDVQKWKVDYEKKDSKLKSRVKDLDELGIEKKKVDSSLKDLSDRFNEETRKRQTLENQLRHAKDDNTDKENAISTLTDKNHSLEDELAKLRSELAEAKRRIQELEDANAILEQKKNALEKDLKDTSFRLNEELDRAKQQIERMNGKLTDSERDLNEQINDLNNQKNNLNRQLQAAQKSTRDTKKTLDDTTKAKDELETKLKKAELDLLEAQSQIDNERKKGGELDKDKRDLNNEILNLQNQLNISKDESTKQDNKFKKLKKEFDDANDKISSLETEKEELERSKAQSDKTGGDIKKDWESTKTQLAQANVDRENLANDLRNTKNQLQSTLESVTRAEQALKQKTDELNNLLSELDSEKNQKTGLDKKRKQFEADLKKLQLRIEEEEKKNRDEVSKREKVETQWREADLTAQTLKSQLEELQRKAKQGDDTNNSLQSQIRDLTDAVNKLKNEKRDLKTQFDELEANYNDLESQHGNVGDTAKTLQQQISDLQSKLDSEKTARSSADQELSRLKQDLDRVRDELGAEVRKQKQAAEKLKLQYETTQNDLQKQVSALTEERNQLKKDLKSASKTPDKKGDVDQEVVDKIKKDFELQYAKLQASFNEEQGARTDAESKKRAFESQVSELRERLDAEERNRKKVESQKKALAAELDELRDAAEEADELRDELNKTRTIQEQQTNNFKTAVDKERTARIQLEEANKKLKDEHDSLKRELDAERNKESTTTSKLRQQYESELSELDSMVNKLKRDKANAQKNQKKFERDQREIAQKLALEQQTRTAAENKVAFLEREMQKTKSELDFHAKNLIKYETENQRLGTELSDYKDRALKLEDEIATLRESTAATSRKSRKLESKFKKFVTTGDSDDDS